MILCVAKDTDVEKSADVLLVVYSRISWPGYEESRFVKYLKTIWCHCYHVASLSQALVRLGKLTTISSIQYWIIFLLDLMALHDLLYHENQGKNSPSPTSCNNWISKNKIKYVISTNFSSLSFCVNYSIVQNMSWFNWGNEKNVEEDQK